MKKQRLLNTTASEMKAMSSQELLNAIKANEGRTMMVETIQFFPGVIPGTKTTNTEVAASLGADMILMNGFDVFKPVIWDLPETDEPIKLVKSLCGRLVGVNLEPVDSEVDMLEARYPVSEGRSATVETFKKAKELGFDFVCLTGNPGTGVSNDAIGNAVKLAHEHFGGIVVAGKMHGAGVDEAIINLEAIELFIENGTDIVLLPAAGTIPGVTQSMVEKACQLIKKKGALSLVTNGASQDSAGKETIAQIAIMNKMAGADIQHIGDSSSGGLAPYQNIMALSIAIRGVRHTLRMMSNSPNR